MKNLTFVGRDFGWFIGCLDNNIEHKHYAIQLSIPLDSPITVHADNHTITTQSPILIQPNIPHQIVSNTNHFLMLLNPASTVGHFWKKANSESIGIYEENPAINLQLLLLQVFTDSAHNQEIKQKINTYINQYDCYCSSFLHKGDDRINKALGFLQENTGRVVPLDEIASYSHLSTSRFLHLFKEQTGITYRRSQLWTKLTLAVQLLGKQTLTEIAYTAGFADSAHFSRTFKENFGFSPQGFLKISQFIQA